MRRVQHELVVVAAGRGRVGGPARRRTGRRPRPGPAKQTDRHLRPGRLQLHGQGAPLGFRQVRLRR